MAAPPAHDGPVVGLGILCEPVRAITVWHRLGRAGAVPILPTVRDYPAGCFQSGPVIGDLIGKMGDTRAADLRLERQADQFAAGSLSLAQTCFIPTSQLKSGL